METVVIRTFHIVTDDVTVDWREFDDSVERAACALARSGIGAGDRVALLMRNDVAFLQVSQACRRIGAYCVPVNWHSAPHEVYYVLRDCSAKLLIAHADLFRSLDLGKLPCPAQVAPTPAHLGDAYRVSAENRSVPEGIGDWAEYTADEISLLAPVPAMETLIYTSGTTGNPKGVCRAPIAPEQRTANEAMRRQVYGIGKGARVLVPAPLYHTAPNFFALRALEHADLLVLPARFAAEPLLAAIARHRITHVYTVPAMFTRLLALPEAVRSGYDVTSLEFVLHAGGPCAPQLKAEMISWLGPVLEEYYGSTEAGPVTHVSSKDWLAHPGTVGRAIDGVRIRIVDDEGRQLPYGDIGEVLTHNRNYPDFTYLNRQMDRDTLNREGMLSSGDLGYLDEDGFLFLCDRKRDLIISGGVNIYPAEVEAAILGIKGIADCAVFGIPDEEFSETVMAVIEPAPNVLLDTTSIEAELRERIAGYKVPRQFELVDRLPREESGKVRKRLLRDPYWAAAGRRI